MGNCLIAELPNDQITDDQGEATDVWPNANFSGFHTVSRIHVLAGAPMPNVLYYMLIPNT